MTTKDASGAGLDGVRVVVIGASSGIGLGIARRALADGADVALVARRREGLEGLADGAGAGHVIVADIAQPDDIRQMAKDVADSLGEVDVVVLAAATARLQPMERMSVDDWAQTLNTNVIGLNLCVAALLPLLATGAIVAAMSSESAGRPNYGLGAYAASKLAVEDSMRAWRIEQPHVRFVTLVIGATVPTDFASNFDEADLVDALAIWAAQGNAPSELMQRDEVADVIVDLVGTVLPNRSVGMETVVLRAPSLPAGSADVLQQAVLNARPGTATDD